MLPQLKEKEQKIVYRKIFKMSYIKVLKRNIYKLKYLMYVYFYIVYVSSTDRYEFSNDASIQNLRMYTYIVYKETVIRKKRTSRVLLKLKERKKKCAIFLFSLSPSLSFDEEKDDDDDDEKAKKWKRDFI